VADAYTGLSNGTLSVKATFPVNGAAAGTELKGQGSFVSPGIFSIPLQTPISTLSTNFVTASVADVQGNTNKVEVRFWVETGFRILSLDASASNNRRLTIRFENRTGSTNHTVVCSDNLSAPLNLWTPLTVVAAADEPNQVRRLEMNLPTGIAGRCFVRVRQQ
jgi:hypothetical protein